MAQYPGGEISTGKQVISGALKWRINRISRSRNASAKYRNGEGITRCVSKKNITTNKKDTVTTSTSALKRKYALQLARTHSRLESTISAIGYITSDSENNPHEPIKLLEINSAISASVFFPVAFGPSDTIPFKRILVELTPKEAKDLENGKLEGCPDNWKIEEWLYKKKFQSTLP